MLTPRGVKILYLVRFNAVLEVDMMIHGKTGLLGITQVKREEIVSECTRLYIELHTKTTWCRT